MSHELHDIDAPTLATWRWESQESAPIAAPAPCDGSAPIGQPTPVAEMPSSAPMSFDRRIRDICAKHYGLSAFDWPETELLDRLDTLATPNEREARLLAAHRAIESKLVDLQNRLGSADSVIASQAERIRQLEADLKRVGRRK